MKLKRISYVLLIVGIFVCGIINVDAATRKSISDFKTYMEDKGYDVTVHSIGSIGLYIIDHESAVVTDGSYSSEDYINFSFVVYNSESEAIEEMADNYDYMLDGDYDIVRKSNVESNTTSSTGSLAATYIEYNMDFYVSIYRIDDTIFTGYGLDQSTIDSVMSGFGYGESSSSSKDNKTLLIVGVVAVAVIIYFSTKKKNPQTVTYVAAPQQDTTYTPVVNEVKNSEEVIFCSECGTKNKGNSKFCIKCGSPLDKS